MTEPRKKNAHLWERHPDDWYVEPDWAAAGIFKVEKFDNKLVDPCCGMGRIVKAGEAAGYEIVGSDIASRYDGCLLRGDYRVWGIQHGRDIVSNPPFKLCDPRGKPDDCFVRYALKASKNKTALLMPTAWLNARKWLRGTGLYRVWLISPRPSMPPGPLVEAGMKPGNGTQDFAWYVWLRGYDGAPTIDWMVRDEL